MKFLASVILLLFFTISFCRAQDNVKVVEKLFDIIGESDSTDIEGLLELVIISDSLLTVNNGEIIGVIEFYAFLFSDQFRERCDKAYKIYYHKEVKPELLSEYELEYTDFENVYYVVCDDEIFTHVILNQGKVISFFPHLRKGGIKATPIMLN